MSLQEKKSDFKQIYEMNNKIQWIEVKNNEIVEASCTCTQKPATSNETVCRHMRSMIGHFLNKGYTWKGSLTKQNEKS